MGVGRGLLFGWVVAVDGLLSVSFVGVFESPWEDGYVGFAWKDCVVGSELGVSWSPLGGG